MRFMVTGRRMGKTTKMVRWLMMNPTAVCLCHNNKAAEDLGRQFPDLKDRFVSTQSLDKLRGQPYDRVGIDNLDLLLPQLLRLPPYVRLGLITASGENDG